MSFDPRVPCRHCGHRAHSTVTGCESCLPGIDCGPEPEPSEAWPDGRGPGSADVVDLAEFEVGPREVICAKCWLVHRPDVDCEQ
ncbi:hypothetical protein PHELEMICH_76 [Mycobacterium phage Phelemich]|uniref:Uncharacterized protein n=2 Tax=Acadianvirus reprobate TaxID=1982903 RepID=S5YDT1_9CAUD|nr:hypothetical protein N847_gp76 [Mycobacterium phage Phelemich]YP_008409999.1 hypothetical protein REPROBATE_78 [Mycobacterium phage Reprobate]AGT12814.1 hypothetical protein REPROBATE_78 [Mycobacterium phage Reprobate]AGT13990.1 hypothetical protein PHELEMICH_76 [Mycobacterium phage Phelemich]